MQSKALLWALCPGQSHMSWGQKLWLFPYLTHRWEVPFPKFSCWAFFLLTGLKFSHVQNARVAHLRSNESQCGKFIGEALGEPGHEIRRWEGAGQDYSLAEDWTFCPFCPFLFLCWERVLHPRLFSGISSEGLVQIYRSLFLFTLWVNNKSHNLNLKDFIVLITPLHLGIYWATAC